MELMDFSEYVFVATGLDKGKRMYDKARVVGAEALSEVRQANCCWWRKPF